MQSILFCDWTTLRTASSAKLTQSESDWVRTDAFQDAAFLVEVRYAAGDGPILYVETAPCPHDRFFVRMFDLELAPLVGSSTVVSALAHSVSGPPLGGFVRWSIIDQDGFEVCMRITMFAI